MPAACPSGLSLAVRQDCWSLGLPQPLPVVLQTSTYRAQQSMGQLPCGPRRSGFSVLATKTQATLPGTAVAPLAVVRDSANLQQPCAKEGSENVVTKTGPRDSAYLLVCGSFGDTVDQNWVVVGDGGLLSLTSPLDSGNHENTKNHVETFWGVVVENGHSISP